MEVQKEVIVVPEGMTKKEWFTSREFAAGAKVGRSTMNLWIQKNPEFRAKHCQRVGGSDLKPRFLIHWKGVAEYIVQKSKTYAGNRHQKYLDPRHLSSAKSVVAEKASQNIERPSTQIVDIDKLLIISQNLAAAFGGLTQKVGQIEQGQIESKQELQKVTARLELHEKELQKPLPITSIHRQFLNDRVRLYAIKTKIEFRRVWQAINTHVGRGSVSFYEFKDFQLALKYLKDMYEEAGMAWGEN